MTKCNMEQNKKTEHKSNIIDDGLKLWLFVVCSVFIVSFTLALVEKYM